MACKLDAFSSNLTYIGPKDQNTSKAKTSYIEINRFKFDPENFLDFEKLNFLTSPQ